MQKCDITGKGKQYGHNVSFSLRRTKKVWKPNLQTKTVVVDGKKVKLKMSTAAIRTLKKKGLLNQVVEQTQKAEKPQKPTTKAAAKPVEKAVEKPATEQKAEAKK